MKQFSTAFNAFGKYREKVKFNQYYVNALFVRGMNSSVKYKKKINSFVANRIRVSVSHVFSKMNEIKSF